MMYPLSFCERKPRQVETASVQIVRGTLDRRKRGPPFGAIRAGPPVLCVLPVLVVRAVVFVAVRATVLIVAVLTHDVTVSASDAPAAVQTFRGACEDGDPGASP